MDDLISRQVAIAEFSCCELTPDGGIDVNYAIDFLEQLPSAESERKTGEWTKDNACPYCGFQPWFERDIHTLSFCPNCGADMRGEQE